MGNSDYSGKYGEKSLLTILWFFGIVSHANGMVGVAQWVECQSVELVVVGSKPITHPTHSNLCAYFGMKRS